jgi:hypothetical protein
MRYFTRDLIERYASPDDAVAAAADAEWEAVHERYEQHLRAIEPGMPEHIREFQNLLLQGAVVWSIARRDDQLIIVLRKDIPPRDLVILTYTLAGEPTIDREALPKAQRSSVMDFRYDEFDLVREREWSGYTQSILFGNGWEVSLRFRDVQFTLAAPLYPVPGMTLVPAGTSAVPHSS